MALFIGLPFFRIGECPPRDEFPSVNGAIWTADFDRIAAELRHSRFNQPASPWRVFPANSPAFLEAGADAFAGGALCGLADRARDGDAVEHPLLGAELAQASVVGGRRGLARGQAGAGLADRKFCRLVGLVAPRRTAGGAWRRHHPLLGHAVAVLQGQGILLADRHLLAQGGAELALVGG